MSDNPYAAPTADVQIDASSHDINGMEYKALRKLYLRSSNINCLTFLVFLGGIAVLAISFSTSMMLIGPGEDMTGLIIMGGIVLLYFVTGYGLYTRAYWGKIMGIIVCILALFNVPLGTILGIAFLFALTKAPQLFGEDRVTHAELKLAYKEAKRKRKEEKKMQKQATA